MSITRKIKTREEIEFFLKETLQIEKFLTDPCNADFLKDQKTNENKINYLINKIKDAEREDSEDYLNNTCDNAEKRCSDYKSEAQRQKLQERIALQLMSQKILDDDDQIVLGNGGMLPKAGKPWCQKKAYFIIGSPASGKSMIAKRISETYRAVIVDSDFIKRAIPEYQGCINGASLVHKESKKILTNLILPIVRAREYNLVYPLVGSRYDEFTELAKLFKGYGYDVSVILTQLDRVKATQRALKRFILTERYVSLSRILDDYSHNSDLTFYKMLYFFPQFRYVLVDADYPLGEKPKIMACGKRAVSLCNHLK
jgi:hypothetical protein